MGKQNLQAKKVFWILFFKIQDPINLYHTEWHIPSEQNMEVPPPAPAPAWGCVSIRKLPKEPLSIYGGEETMHLLMMTYRQDIACVIHGRSFPKYTQAHLSTEVFMLKNNFTTLSFKSNTKFSVILIVRITN